MFHKLELIKLEDISGDTASVYSFILDDEEDTAFEKFVSENISLFKSEIIDIVSRLNTIGKDTGARLIYFKEKEGNLGDGVCALFDKPNSNLRLYCIHYGKQLILLGGGGHKPKTISALQEEPKLKQENYLLREISKLITQKMREREIKISDMEFEGDLIIYNDNYEN